MSRRLRRFYFWRCQFCERRARCAWTGQRWLCATCDHDGLIRLIDEVKCLRERA